MVQNPELTPNLSDYDWLILQEISSTVSGLTLDEVWSRVKHHENLDPGFYSKIIVEPALLNLRTLGLVSSVGLEGSPLWMRTPKGDLVNNWRVQLTWPEVGPEPRSGETGDKRASSSPCDQYRPVHRIPGNCWCGWHRVDHTASAQAKGAEPS